MPSDAVHCELFSREFHTPSLVCSRSPFLLTTSKFTTPHMRKDLSFAVCAISSKFDTQRPDPPTIIRKTSAAGSANDSSSIYSDHRQDLMVYVSYHNSATAYCYTMTFKTISTNDSHPLAREPSIMVELSSHEAGRMQTCVLVHVFDERIASCLLVIGCRHDCSYVDITNWKRDTSHVSTTIPSHYFADVHIWLFHRMCAPQSATDVSSKFSFSLKTGC
jgi:hypothetical protein